MVDIMNRLIKSSGWLLLCLVGMVQADDYDHEQVKRLHDAGELVALEQITEDVRKRFGGRILEIELERKRQRYVYEIEVLDAQGTVRELYYDARNGQFLRQE